MHFSEKMNKARLKAMSMMICALCKVQRVTYTKLAAAFDNGALAGSSLRRIQRLIAECVINTDLIAKLILKLIPVEGRYNLSMDRTNWKYGDTNINILNLGVIYDGMAFPVIYIMMDKRGNSNTAERIELIERFLRLAGEDSITHLMADREFIGEEWFGYLNSMLVSYCNAEESLDMYHKRWQIETMHKGLKSSGFDIEGSHVRDLGRMSNLLSIIMIAYVWCYLVGIYIHENIKPIKVLKHGRRAVSLFKYGLDYIYQCLVNHTDRYRIDVFKFLSYT